MRILYSSFDNKQHNSFEEALTHEFEKFNEIALLTKDLLSKTQSHCSTYKYCGEGCPFWDEENEVCLRVKLLELTNHEFYSSEELDGLKKDLIERKDK